MTVSNLHKMLGDLIAKGHGRKGVCVDKATFSHNCEEDGVTILPVKDAKLKVIWIDDGDGCAKLRKDGIPCESTELVLTGDS